MPDELKIILYPDPRLKKRSEPVTVFDDNLRDMVVQMFKLMRESHGVGLAAPQVGVNLRLFVMNPSGEPGDDQVYINPVLSDGDGNDDAEEGCLSLPDIRVKITRDKAITIRAQDLDGTPFEQSATGFVTRVWQHEFDHLNGILITDRMGPVAKMTHRKRLKELEDLYKKKGG
ncbi:MAG TPA: peptide deformylase [Tepidisphaeraceae bacterium]|nr:peptide deformylase [Tepidisphaeraceae bacterium]